MVVNLGKFQVIILNKKKNNHTQEIIKIVKKAVKVRSSVKLLGVQIDAELNFNLHNANICRSATNQLKVACVVDTKLFFMDWFCYDLIILIK